MVKGVLAKVERERRIPWNREFGDFSYRTWEPKPKNISPLNRVMRLDKSEKDHRKNRFEELEEIAEMEDHLEEDEPEDRPSGTRERRKERCSYLFGFDSEDAALTFVQYWHRRPLETTGMSYDSDDLAPVVNAELLW
jgi:hypothetical protein